MSFVQTYGKELVALAVPLITWALNSFFKGKARLRLASPHTFTFLLHEPRLDSEGKTISPTQTLATRSYMAWNGGREAATRVEWVFNWKPLGINFWPPRHYEEKTAPDGRYVVVFPSLAPNEHMGCELMALNAELPNIITVRCDQCVSSHIAMLPQPEVRPWQRRLAGFLILVGSGAALYALLVLIQLVVLKTPAIF